MNDCIRCGKKIKKSYYKDAYREFFCTLTCAGIFGTICAKQGFRLTEKKL